MPTIRRVVEYDTDEMARRGRLGAAKLHSTRNPRETTAKAREAFQLRFEDEVDPERSLPEDERARRVDLARKAYYSRLSRKGAEARRARKAAAE